MDRAPLNEAGRLALPMLRLMCAMRVTFVHCSASDFAKGVLAYGEGAKLYFFCAHCQVLDTPSKSVPETAEPA